MTHTPGPWRTEKTKTDHAIWTDGVADMKFVLAHAFKAPDARLIAAAPALLEALERIAKVTTATTEPTTRLHDIAGIARAAITLAKGAPECAQPA